MHFVAVSVFTVRTVLGFTLSSLCNGPRPNYSYYKYISQPLLGLGFLQHSTFTCSLLMQHASLSPDRKVVVIVGDDPDGLLIDANSGKVPLLIHML